MRIEKPTLDRRAKKVRWIEAESAIFHRPSNQDHARTNSPKAKDIGRFVNYQGEAHEAMTESIKSTQQERPGSSTEHVILEMAGFTLSTATILISAYSPLLATANTNTPVMHGFTHGIMFVFMTAFYFLMSHFVKKRDTFIRIKSARSLFFALQLVLPLIAILESAIQTAPPIGAVLVAWAAFGTAGAYFTCAWIDAQSALGEDRIRTANLWSFCAAGCIAAAILAMPETTGTAAFAIMCAASFVLLLQLPTKPSETMSEHDERWFSENSKYSTSGSYIMIVDGATIGIIAGLLVARISKDVLPPATMGIVFMVVAFAFFLLDRKAPTILALGRSQLAFLPILVCGLVLSGFLAAPWNTIASLPLFAVLYLFDYTNSSVLSLRGSLLSISPCYCFAKGRFFITLGQAIGWFGGAFLASDIGRGALPAVSVIMVFLVCAYITAAAIKPEKYPIITDEAKLPQAQAGEVPPPRSTSTRTNRRAALQA